MIRSITGNFHITRNGDDSIVIFVHHMQMTIAPHLAELSAEVHLFALFRLGNQPRSSHGLPVVGQFHLLAVHDALLENTEFIAQRIAGGRNTQRGHRVEIAGSQTAKPPLPRPASGSISKISALLNPMFSMAPFIASSTPRL